MSIKQKINKASKYPVNALHIYFNKEDLKVLHSMKLYADDKYYNSGQPSGFDDSHYDVLKSVLETRDPDYTVPVGIKIRKGENRTELPFWLGSMDKIMTKSPILVFINEHEDHIIEEMGDETPISEIINRGTTMYEELSDKKKDKYINAVKNEFAHEVALWISKNISDEYIVEDKLDGVSCLLIMENGKIKLYTRGDGIIGADISYLAQYFDSIPKNLDETINVRGELIMKKQVFETKHSKDHSNPRNLVAGRIGGKTVRKGLTDIEFVAYEIVGDEKMEKASDQLKRLDSLGFTTVDRTIMSDLTINGLQENLAYNKKHSEYEIDGVICQPNKPYYRNSDGNPSYAFAFKMMMGGNILDTKVVDVQWNVSKWGQLKPRIELEPISLGGVTITWTSGFNARFIVDECIGPGAIVKITRSGDVIPYIVAVTKKADEPSLPDVEYKWNDTNIDIYTEEYGDRMCIKLITSFFAKLGIKHVGDKAVTKMYTHGLDTLLKIIAATEGELSEVPGFGKRMAERAHTNIHAGIENMSLPIVLGSSGIFGFGLGRKKITTLLNDIPDLLVIFKTMSKAQLMERVLQVDGFSHKTAKKIVDNLDWAEKFIEALKYFGSFKVEEKSGDELKGMKFVFTGFRDKNLEEKVVSNGGKVTTSVSGNTSVLVVASLSGKQSAKMKKASKLGVEILDKQGFIDKYIN